VLRGYAVEHGQALTRLRAAGNTPPKMTHKLIHTLLGFMLLIVLASPTMAGTQQPASTNTPSMKPVGPVIANLVVKLRAIVEIREFFIRREWFRIGHYAYKFEYPHDLHDFGPKWGPLQGVRPYLKVNRYATRLDPKTGLPMRKEFILGEYIYPWERTPYGDKMPYFEQFRIPWGRRDNLGKRPRRFVVDDSDLWVIAVAKEIQIREEWMKLNVAKETQIFEEWIRQNEGASHSSQMIDLINSWKLGPRSGDPYEGPLPSPHLIDLIFGIVAGASW